MTERTEYLSEVLRTINETEDWDDLPVEIAIVIVQCGAIANKAKTKWFDIFGQIETV